VERKGYIVSVITSESEGLVSYHKFVNDITTASKVLCRLDNNKRIPLSTFNIPKTNLNNEKYPISFYAYCYEEDIEEVRKSLIEKTLEKIAELLKEKNKLSSVLQKYAEANCTAIIRTIKNDD
jgi:hypothetical protein